VVRGNRHAGPEPEAFELTIKGAVLENNENYTVTDKLTYR
jgi:hypothetical protein